ncbi:hypothetical protein K474DRAFT_785786 [Panus rudis PR-1116 ss-1]|nr:hypothetical protein K474DRAFT_785786 [Panus rudis PR-1116 ss-1]
MRMAAESVKAECSSQEQPALKLDGGDGISEAALHPVFTYDDADVILRSRDGTLFRVYSLPLRLSSGWFRTLFTLPQSTQPRSPGTSSHEAPSEQKEILPTDETSDVLSVILSISHGLEVPPLKTIDEIDAVAHAAEKYDMPGVLSHLRLAVIAPSIIEEHPIRVYGLACRWGWTEEAKLASSHTVSLDLLSPDLLPNLKCVDPIPLAKLLRLQRQRKEALRRGLDSPDTFYANIAPARCQNEVCTVEVIHDRWQQLKYSWLTMIDEKPEVFVSMRVLDSMEVSNVIEFKCLRCGRKQYNTERTLSNLRTVLESLPKTVEL